MTEWYAGSGGSSAGDGDGDGAARTAAPEASARPAASGSADTFAQWFQRVEANVASVIQGAHEAVRLSLVALFAEGHLLIEDVPGMGKTTLARSLAASMDVGWKRIQFTPDLLPSDVTGVSIYHQHSQSFEFHPGPVFANVVLADEVNRASPKTQAALLEVMAERHVTVDGVQHQAPRPFLVMATQNPIELEGTYRLPEAQLDRFLIRTGLGAPDVATESRILRVHSAPGEPVVDSLQPVIDATTARQLIAFAETVHLSDAVLDYVARIAAATRGHGDLRLGVSPRGSLGLVRAARVVAAAAGREYVVAEDVKALAEPVLAHRMVLTAEAELAGRRTSDVVAEVLDQVAVPTERVG